MPTLIKNLTLRNFLSVGNVTQAVSFDGGGLTLVIGENMDQGGGDAERNGVGKTTIFNALSYAIYGSALTPIKMPNLVNTTNGKGMLVTLEFSKDGIDYRIERGRSPSVLKFFVDGTEGEEDEGQGDMRDTQERIAEVFGMSHLMFKHIVALSTDSEGHTNAFLALGAAGQRGIIEDLLGVTTLSERADALRERIKATKSRVQEEEYKISALESANASIQSSIDDMKKRRKEWKEDRAERIEGLEVKMERLAKVDVKAEKEAHGIIAANREARRERRDLEKAAERAESELDSAKRKRDSWKSERVERAEGIAAKIKTLKELDVDAELAAHRTIAASAEKRAERASAEKARDAGEKAERRALKAAEALEREIAALDDRKCFACGQTLHDGDRDRMLKEKNAEADEAKKAAAEAAAEAKKAAKAMKKIGEIPEDPETRYDSEDEAREHRGRIEALESKLADMDGESNPHGESVDEAKTALKKAKKELSAAPEIPADPETHFETMDGVREHEKKVDTFGARLEALRGEKDPYREQIAKLREDGLKKVPRGEMDRLVRLREHEDYLLKLLTNKDSFIRKRIIDQNLAFLNARLEDYLGKLRLPHMVVFNSDLTVSISELGRGLDFYNLSKGERSRLSLGLSWSFRDVHETMHDSVDFMAVDEVIDSGLDASGIECAMEVLRSFYEERGKNVFIVSHRKEMAELAESTIHVIKEDGFTRFETRDG